MANVICVECNAEVSDEYEYCTECGFPFASLQPMTCPGCGNKVVFTADACPVCSLSYEQAMRLTAAAPSADEPIGASVAEPDVVIIPEPASIAVAQPESRVEEDRTEVLPLVEDLPEKLPEPVVEGDTEDSRAEEAEVLPVADVASPKEDVMAAAVSPTPEKIPDMVAETASPAGVGLEPVEKIALVGLATDQSAQLKALQEEIARLGALIAAQQEDGVNRELLSAVASELGGSIARLEAGQKTLATDLAAEMGKLKSKDSGSAEGEAAPEKPGDTVDYIFYGVLAVLLFTVLNSLIAAYLVRLAK